MFELGNWEGLGKCDGNWQKLGKVMPMCSSSMQIYERVVEFVFCDCYLLSTPYDTISVKEE